MTPNFNIVNFDELKATTKTFIVMTNIKFNLNSLFTALPITTYEVDLKKRGKKRIRNSEDLNNGIENGSIITLKFENKIRGIDMKQKLNNTKKKSKWFRNSFTVVMIINNKQVNFKICKNGILQFTGCKYDNYVDECLKSLWKNLKNKENSDLFSFTRGNFLECLIIPAMRNIDFNVGFNIDREKLSMYISKNTNFYSLLETSFGYTGVNIKIPITKDLTQLEIKKIMYIDNEWLETKSIYEEYLNLLPIKDKEKKLSKTKYTTFLVFQSGKMLCTSINEEISREHYYIFTDIINKCKDIIEEKLV